MNWLERLTGIVEYSPDHVRAQLHLDGERLHSRVNGRAMVCGRLEMPSLAELRRRAAATSARGRTTLRERVADVQALHADADHAGALFQVASQFNLLEMIAPQVTPEHGIARYEADSTQGPACAIAAGAGTLYRNYLVPVGDQVGQSRDRQIDCLADIGAMLGNRDQRLWQMRNGYALPNEAGLTEIARTLRAMDEDARDAVRAALRIGIQWGTEVTLDGCGHRVTQAYCSALPVAYSRLPVPLWEPFARLVLEAAYEATLCAGRINLHEHGEPRVFLTLLGGGAFGNPPEWIGDAIVRALQLHADSGLQVAIVSRGASNPVVAEIISALG